MRKRKYVVIGAGFFGLTIAERIANVLHSPVEIFEKRQHIGGNAWSEIDSETGIEVHKYGSHLFHTSSFEVWNYVNSFTDFNNYRHFVWTKHNGKTFSIPINLSTMNSFFNQDFTPRSARDFVSSFEKPQKNDNFEDLAIGAIGKELYEAFIKGYTEKQWQTNPKMLPPETFSRLPVRFNFNSRYFNDTWEGLPTKGYFGLFQEMISNPLISINLGSDYFSLRGEIDPSSVLIYTGAIDQYFEFEFGPLTWRTLDFDFEILNVDDFQGTSVMNYADLNDAFTRIHEFKHLHPERTHIENKTIIAREYSRFAAYGDEPYYPVNTAQDRMKLVKYRKLAKGSPCVHFGGRLGSYKYLDMHMAIASALQLFNSKINNSL